MQKYKTTQFLLITASVMVLSSCLPEDETILLERERTNLEAQLDLYAQTFQTYASRSLNALVSSAVWAAQTLPEGAIDLSTPAFGSLSMGNAESYMQSAHCKINGDSYHITWFDAKDDNGELSLKGLGSAQSMRASSKAREYIPVENFAVADGTTMKFVDGIEQSLTGPCAALNIPNGSAIAAYKIDTPTKMAMAQEKTILRASNCPAGEQGAITEKINAVFKNDGLVLVDRSQYSSESEAILNHSSGWDPVSNDCVSMVAGLNRDIDNKTSNAINAEHLEGIDGVIKLALLDNLQNMNCRQLNDVMSSEDREKLYETCEDAGDLNITDGMGIQEKTLLRKEEEVIIAECPTPPLNNGTLTINTSSPLYAGLHPSLNGRSGVQSGEVSGETRLQKITRFYEISVDYGDRQEKKETQQVTMKGTDIQCSGTDTLTFTCAQLYPQNAATGTGPTFSRNKSLNSWKDADKLIPGEYSHDTWALNSQLSCSLTEVSNSGGCGTAIQQRTGTVTAVGQDIQWDAWTVTGHNAACYSGGGGDDPYGFDVDGDGIPDFHSYGAARDYVESVGGNVKAGGDIVQVDMEVIGPDGPSSGGGGGGGSSGGSSGGGGGKVLCTYFHHKGWIDDAIYRADSEYARLHVSENTKNGYHRWAVPMVKWLQEKERPIAEKFIFIWVNAWAHQMAYDMGVIEKRSYIGTFLKSFGEPLCNFIGRFSKETNYMELWKGI